MRSPRRFHGGSKSRTSPRLIREALLPHPAHKWAAALLSASVITGFATLITALGLAVLVDRDARTPMRAVVHVSGADDLRPGGASPAREAPKPSAEVLLPSARAAPIATLDEQNYALVGDAPEDAVDAEDFEVAGDRRRPDGLVAPASAGVLERETDGIGNWAGREVRVNGECAAQVEGFAVVIEVAGSSQSMPIESWDDPDEHEIAQTLSEYTSGRAALKIRGCEDALRTGEASAPDVARDAALPPARAAVRIEDSGLELRARELLLRSDASESAETIPAGTGSADAAWWELSSASVEAEVLRHPETGAEVVSVSARAYEGCGRTAAHLWGLYEVDERGALETIAVHELDPRTTLHGAYEFAPDGELAWLKSRPFGGSALLNRDAEPQAESEVLFFGCPC